MDEIICNEFDQYGDAIRGVEGRYLAVGRRLSDWRLAVLDLGDVVLMDAADGAMNVFDGLAARDFHSIFIPQTPPAETSLNGRRFKSDEFAWLASGQSVHFCSRSASRWIACNFRASGLLPRLFINDEHLEPAELMCVRFVGNDKHALARIASIVRRAFAVDAQDRQALRHPAVRDALCGQLLEAVASSLAAARIEGRPTRGRPRADALAVLERVVALVEQNPTTVWHVDDLCRVAQVSWRTLRMIFADHFGTSPQQFLMIRRLHAIRRALRCAGRGDTVTAICATYGIWDVGRFAGQFRQFFGVLPSEVLRRRAGEWA